MKELKLKQLEKSFENGMISEEEYKQKKKELEALPTVQEKLTEEAQDTSIKSDWVLILLIAIIVLIVGGFLGWIALSQQDNRQLTLEELHELNLKGELDPEQGVVYEGAFSFVKFNDVWYTQLQSPRGTRLYNIQFRFNPVEVESIPFEGSFDVGKFDTASEYFVTFNPVEGNFSAIALAVGDFNQQMTPIFFKNPIAACDRNETEACATRPIVTCNSTDELVLYVKEAAKTQVTFDGSCIMVEGTGLELVKAIDKLLYVFYGVIVPDVEGFNQ